MQICVRVWHICVLMCIHVCVCIWLLVWTYWYAHICVCVGECVFAIFVWHFKPSSVFLYIIYIAHCAIILLCTLMLYICDRLTPDLNKDDDELDIFWGIDIYVKHTKTMKRLFSIMYIQLLELSICVCACVCFPADVFASSPSAVTLLTTNNTLLYEITSVI